MTSVVQEVASKPSSGPGEWVGQVDNFDNANDAFSVIVVCVPLSVVSTVAASPTAVARSQQEIVVPCPDGSFAIGGGPAEGALAYGTIGIVAGRLIEPSTWDVWVDNYSSVDQQLEADTVCVSSPT